MKRHMAVQAAHTDVQVLVLQAQGWKPLLEHAKVRFRYGLPDKRRRDLDNLISASKPYLDALVGLVIVDDNHRNITLEYDWFDSPKRPVTIMEVEAA